MAILRDSTLTLEEEKNKKKEKKKKKGSGIKLFGKILLGIFIFILLLLLFIRSPWGQGIITDKLVSYISGKTNTTVEVERLFITFGGDIYLEGLYLEDKDGDTLVYSQKLEADVPLWPIIQGNGFAIDNLEWSGVRANITRQDTVQGFNFEFLMDAFATADTTTTATPADTTASSMQISVGDVDLENFKVTYQDGYMGIETRVDLGSLVVGMQEFNLDSMVFEIGDASLENTRFSYLQTKPFPEQEQQEDPPMPFFSVESLRINNVIGDYQSIPDGFLTDVDINTLLLEMPEVDLSQQKILIEMLGLKNSEILIKTTQTAEASETSETTTESPEETTPFEWPAWQVELREVSLLDNRFRFIIDGATPQAGAFNPNAISLRDFTFVANDLVLADQSLKAQVEKLSFEEISGLDLKESTFELEISEERLVLSDLGLQLNENRVQGSLLINYDSLSQFLEQPENASVDLNIPNFNVNLQDLFRIQPDLKQNEYLAALAEKELRGSFSAEGNLSELQIGNADITWGQNTSLSATGTVFDATDPENIRFNFQDIQFTSGKADLRPFIKNLDLGIELPERMELVGDVNGSPEDIRVDAVLKSSAGRVAVDGRFQTAPGIAFNANIQVTELEVGQLLQNPALGPVSLELSASGSGEDLNSLDAVVEGNVGSLTYNEYEFQDINLYAELEDGEGFANVDYKDENLNMELESFVELDSIAPAIAVNLNLIGADLMALGITTRPVNTAMELEAVFEGNAEEFDLVANIAEPVFVYDNESYLMGDLDLLAHVRQDTTSMDIDNRMLDLRLSSNASPTDFINALDRHYQSYYSEEERMDTIENPVNLELRAEINPSPILEEVFLPKLEELDTVNIQVDFNEREKMLAADVNLPHVVYFGSEIDSLAFTMDSDQEGLRFNLGLQSLDAGPLAIKETYLEGQLIVEELLLQFTSNYEDEVLMNIQSWISSEDDVLQIHIDPDNLVLNSVPWNIEPENEILIGDNFWTFNDFRLYRNNQFLRAGNDLEQVQKEHIGIEFQNFNLAALLSYLNPEEVLVSGKMNGNLIIEEPFAETGLLADLTIRDFGVSSVPLGVLTFDAEAIGTRTYNFDLALKEGNADLDLTGSYIASEQAANLDMQLDLNEIRMEVIEGFSNGAITATDGSFSGQIMVNGTTVEPNYEGFLDFNQAAFTVAMLDAPFMLPNERLRLDDDGFYMDNFRIEDNNGSPFIVDGAILTESLLNPEFDISFSAENFKALSSTEEDNDLYYGTAIFDATGSVTGNLELPKVELDLSVKEDTNLTYVIPSATVGVEAREGVVVFVNRQNPDRILTQTQEQADAISFSGFQLNSYISIEENATFSVVIDEETGDHFQGSGDGDLLFDVYPNGRTTLSGRVELNDGYYEMGLYNLVTRRFDIVEGSSIVWAGDPLDADLNITAVYRVETSASALMAPQITGADMDVRNRFRQELEFLVYLEIGGEISAPRISFGLDMPEDEQGSLGGQVYGRVQQINQQENELNKQVFSLLVLNRFFPGSGSDGAAGGTMAFARDNLNQALSDQLNIFSDRLLGDSGVNLNFGLDSYTDYQGDSPEERTQLDITAEKTFLDDRLKVSVGSEVDLQGSSQVEEGTPVIGNVGLEYLLTRDGRYRLEAFRRKSYENVIDGQLIVSGLGLIFTQEFNKFNELWDQIVKDEQKNQQNTEDQNGEKGTN